MPDPDAFSLFKEDFEGNDFELRRKTIGRTLIVALAIGPAKTREELMPYLVDLIAATREQDELLFVLAKQLGSKMVEAVGGPSYAHAILPPLEALANFEETVVREQAVSSLIQVVKAMPGVSEVVEHALPVYTRLASAEWFTPRVSACGIAPVLLERVPDDRSERQTIIDTYRKLGADDTPMVRRAAARAVSEVSTVMDVAEIKECLLRLITEWSAEPQQSVRTITVKCFANVATELRKKDGLSDDVKAKFSSLFKEYSCDRSWKLRTVLASQLKDTANAFGKESTIQDLMSTVLDLLHDPKDDVRAETSKHLPDLAGLIGKETFRKEILPGLKEVVEGETTLIVRSSVATTSVELVDYLDHDDIEAHLRPIWEQFLSDSLGAGHPSVRYLIMDSIPRIIVALGPEKFFGKGGMSETVVELYNDSLSHVDNNPIDVGEIETPRWRLRWALVSSLDEIAKKGGKTSLDFVVGIWSRALSDIVNNVRIAAANVLEAFCEEDSGVGGVEIVKSKLLPQLKSFGTDTQNQSYIRRISYFRCCLATRKCPSIWSELEPEFAKGFEDPVANVRYAVLRMASGDLSSLSASTKSKIEELAANDDDPDAKELAREALVSF